MNEFQRKILGAMAGNAIEFYDFSLFGALADVIGDLFFPSTDKTFQLLESLTVFGAAFVCRPLGGMLIGKLGDVYGRKKALEISILIMLIPTFLMGCLPTYNDINGASTVLVIIIRLVQGVAAGGEFSSSLVYAVESTNGKDCAFWSAFVNAGANVGSLAGVGIVALIRNTLSRQELLSWGWRIPFLLTPIFGILGLWLRYSLKENEDSMNISKSPDRRVFVELFFNHWREMAMLVFLLTCWGPIFYVCFVWIPVYLADIISSSHIVDPWTLNFCMLVLHTILMPVFGIGVDSLGRHLNNKMLAYKYSLRIAAISFFGLAFPAFFCLSSHSLALVVLGNTLIVAPSALFGAAMAPYMIHQFPVNLRLTGLGFSFNIAQAIFVSSATIICTLFAGVDRTAPAYYIVIMAVISLAALTVGVQIVERHRVKYPLSIYQTSSTTGISIGSMNTNSYASIKRDSSDEDLTPNPLLVGELTKRVTLSNDSSGVSTNAHRSTASTGSGSGSAEFNPMHFSV